MRYKVMAFHRSSGLWNKHCQIKLKWIINQRDEALEAHLAAWQATYDAQFRKYPYEFDWDAFNQQGRELTARIHDLTPESIEVYYVESDDRDFFNPEDCELFNFNPARQD